MKPIPLAHLVSLRTVGGVERFFVNFATKTSKTFEHHVFLSTDEVHEFFRPQLAEAGIKLHSLRQWKFVRLPKFPGFLRKALHHKIVVDNNIQALVLWNKLEFFPIHFPNDLKLIHFERGSAWLAQGDSNVREHLKRCHAILSNSKGGLEILKGRWGLPEKTPTFVAYNGVNPNFTKTDAPVKQLGEVVKLGFAGRFVPLKGWILSLQTLQELNRRSPGKYRLIVGGEGRQKKLFQELVQKWGLQEYVEDMGLVKNMQQFFDKIDVFLHTSLREPFGNVAVEAQACGCPVVGGLMDGNPEIIRDQESGLLLEMKVPVESLQTISEELLEVPPFVWDPVTRKLRKPSLMATTDMADAVEKITQDAATLTRYSQQAAQWIRSEYDFAYRSQMLERTLIQALDLGV